MGIAVGDSVAGLGAAVGAFTGASVVGAFVGAPVALQLVELSEASMKPSRQWHA